MNTVRCLAQNLLLLPQLGHLPSQPAQLPISVELGDRPVPRQAVAPDGVVEKEMFTLDTDGDSNPYAWEVDLCAVTLANFNYRTLTSSVTTKP